MILPCSLIGLTVDKVTGGRKINSNLIGKVHLKVTNVNIVDRTRLYLFMSLVDGWQMAVYSVDKATLI